MSLLILGGAPLPAANRPTPGTAVASSSAFATVLAELSPAAVPTARPVAASTTQIPTMPAAVPVAVPPSFGQAMPTGLRGVVANTGDPAATGSEGATVLEETLAEENLPEDTIPADPPPAGTAPADTVSAEPEPSSALGEPIPVPEATPVPSSTVPATAQAPSNVGSIVIDSQPPAAAQLAPSAGATVPPAPTLDTTTSSATGLTGVRSPEPTTSLPVHPSNSVTTAYWAIAQAIAQAPASASAPAVEAESAAAVFPTLPVQTSGATPSTTITPTATQATAAQPAAPSAAALATVLATGSPAGAIPADTTDTTTVDNSIDSTKDTAISASTTTASTSTSSTSTALTPAPSPAPTPAPAAPVPTPAAAPSAAATPSVLVPLATQIARPIFTLAGASNGEHTLTINVTPDDLGPVTVRAHVSGDSLRLELFAPTDGGREALRQMLTDLRRDLAGSGMTASLDISGDAQPKDPEARSDQQQPGQHRNRAEPHPAAALGDNANGSTDRNRQFGSEGFPDRPAIGSNLQLDVMA
ncbi:MAG: hypothetical protein JWQ43_2296 [Glaciihabitans sp.]|nr:hypothetical protein [Glaciihabitans sp.]